MMRSSVDAPAERPPSVPQQRPAQEFASGNETRRTFIERGHAVRRIVHRAPGDLTEQRIDRVDALGVEPVVDGVRAGRVGSTSASLRRTRT